MAVLDFEGPIMLIMTLIVTFIEFVFLFFKNLFTDLCGFFMSYSKT